MSSSAALTRIATFRLSPKTSLCIAQGSVVDFAWPTKRKAAIVNAANELCLGGGGVDGAISAAGGPNLYKDRKALPLHMGVRCFTGDAVLTGPNDYGSLQVQNVIHAVGPNYFDCATHREGDTFLRKAYEASLERAQEADLEAIAFALLSAGIYRGTQSSYNVLRIGISTIQDWVRSRDDSHDYCNLTHIYICGFSPKQVDLLVDICHDLQIPAVDDDDDKDDPNDK